MFPLKVVFFGGGEKKLLLAFTDIKSAVKMKSKSFSAHRQEQLPSWGMFPSVILSTF